MNWFKKSSFEYSEANQDGWEEYFGDIQRYGMDAYSCRVTHTKTKKKITICITLSMQQMGTVMWQKFWRYDVDENPIAFKTFKEAKKIVSEILEDFRENEIPNTTLWQYLRNGTQDLDKEHIAKSGIPQINWANDIVYEKDAREQIYGKRYPYFDGF